MLIRVQWLDGADFIGPDFEAVLSQHLGDPFCGRPDAHYYMKDCLDRFTLFTGRDSSQVPLLPEPFFKFLFEERMLLIEYIPDKEEEKYFGM